jgi:hypothetical protein
MPENLLDRGDVKRAAPSRPVREFSRSTFRREPQVFKIKTNRILRIIRMKTGFDLILKILDILLYF